jgi:hypothetical protein
MKLTDWLKTVVSPLFKTPEDADLFLSASDLKAVEVPEEIQKAFNDKYLTRDRAVTDEEIMRKLTLEARGRVFDSVDLKLKKVKALLSQEDQDLIDNEKNTLLKLDLLEKAIQNVGSGKNDDVKKVNDAYRKKEAEFHEKISSLEDTLKQKDANFGKEIKEVKLDYALRTMLAGFELAPEFASEEHRTFLAESTIHSLKQNYKVEFDEKDERVLHLRKEVDGATTDVYEGNTKVGLTDVLKKKYEPYLKKSAGAGNGGHNPPPEQKKKQELPTDRPLTHRERMIAAAKD